MPETVRRVIRRSALVAIIGLMGELLIFGSAPADAAIFAVVAGVLYCAIALVIERRLARPKDVP